MELIFCNKNLSSRLNNLFWRRIFLYLRRLILNWYINLWYDCIILAYFRRCPHNQRRVALLIIIYFVLLRRITRWNSNCWRTLCIKLTRRIIDRLMWWNFIYNVILRIVRIENRSVIRFGEKNRWICSVILAIHLFKIRRRLNQRNKIYNLTWICFIRLWYLFYMRFTWGKRFSWFRTGSTNILMNFDRNELFLHIYLFINQLVSFFKQKVVLFF